MTIIGHSYSLVKSSTKCAPALVGGGDRLRGGLAMYSLNNQLSAEQEQQQRQRADRSQNDCFQADRGVLRGLHNENQPRLSIAQTVNGSSPRICPEVYLSSSENRAQIRDRGNQIYNQSIARLQCHRVYS